MSFITSEFHAILLICFNGVVLTNCFSSIFHFRQISKLKKSVTPRNKKGIKISCGYVHLHIMSFITTKFHEIRLSSFRGVGLTRKTGLTDWLTDGRVKNIIPSATRCVGYKKISSNIWMKVKSPVLHSAERALANVYLLNNSFDVIFYCSEGERSQMLILLNAALYIHAPVSLNQHVYILIDPAVELDMLTIQTTYQTCCDLQQIDSDWRVLLGLPFQPAFQAFSGTGLACDFFSDTRQPRLIQD